MRFTCIAFPVTCFGLFQCFIKSEDVPHGKSKEEVDDESAKMKYENHTFVALIDIVFTDRSKRSCTGSIIHDNVVITAANCFVHEFEENIQPELTTSFVVIGSKKMFDSGYEQYLPIERILIHPKFGHGWTADLALVYTFAGMTSDKPGEIIPLAGERMSNPVDSNVTVFSWGHCADEKVVGHSGAIAHQLECIVCGDQAQSHVCFVSEPLFDHVVLTTANLNEPDRNSNKKKTTKPSCDEASSGDTGCEEPSGDAVGSKRSRGGHQQQKLKAQPPRRRPGTKKPVRQQYRFQTQFRQNEGLQEHPMLSEEQSVRSKRPSMTKQLSRYLPSNEGNEDHDYQNDEYQPSRNSTERPGPQMKNHHNNMENKLTVEIFGFVNLATCKKIVEGALPPRYEIKSGEVVCYSSEEHYITDEDSGAPAIRHGQLVAVTVGGAQCDGDHVGVGIKMSCYCSWIAENLPGNSENMNCCKNCCDANKHSEDSSKAMFRKKNQHNINY